MKSNHQCYLMGHACGTTSKKSLPVVRQNQFSPVCSRSQIVSVCCALAVIGCPFTFCPSSQPTTFSLDGFPSDFCNPKITGIPTLTSKRVNNHPSFASARFLCLLRWEISSGQWQLTYDSQASPGDHAPRRDTDQTELHETHGESISNLCSLIELYLTDNRSCKLRCTTRWLLYRCAGKWSHHREAS